VNDSDYALWPAFTIEQVPGEFPRYRARVTVIELASGDNIAFNSDHAQYRDAEEAVEVVRGAVIAPSGHPRLSNLFAETIDEYSADHGGGEFVNVMEARALIWSFDSPAS
jgi:hypothetical protein